MKDKKDKNENAKINTKAVIIAAVVAVIVALGAAVYFAVFGATLPKIGAGDPVATDRTADEIFAPADTVIIPTDTASDEIELVEGFNEPEETVVSEEDGTKDLSNGLKLMALGSYDGQFIEDGTDEEVTGVMSAVVYNASGKNIQYAEVYVVLENDETYEFSATTIPAGSSVVLLEKNRKTYDCKVPVKSASSGNIAFFIEEMNLYPDMFTVECTDGYIRVTNKSGADVNGNLTLYYKQTKDGQYFGGITYSATLRGGIKAGASAMLPVNHYKAATSKLMFIMLPQETEE